MMEIWALLNPQVGKYLSRQIYSEYFWLMIMIAVVIQNSLADLHVNNVSPGHHSYLTSAYINRSM